MTNYVAWLLIIDVHAARIKGLAVNVKEPAFAQRVNPFARALKPTAKAFNPAANRTTIESSPGLQPAIKQLTAPVETVLFRTVRDGYNAAFRIPKADLAAFSQPPPVHSFADWEDAYDTSSDTDDDLVDVDPGNDQPAPGSKSPETLAWEAIDARRLSYIPQPAGLRYIDRTEAVPRLAGANEYYAVPRVNEPAIDPRWAMLGERRSMPQPSDKRFTHPMEDALLRAEAKNSAGAMGSAQVTPALKSPINFSDWDVGLSSPVPQLSDNRSTSPISFQVFCDKVKKAQAMSALKENDKPVAVGTDRGITPLPQTYVSAIYLPCESCLTSIVGTEAR